MYKLHPGVNTDRHMNRTASSSSADETATALGNVAAILSHPTTNSNVLEVLIQPPGTNVSADDRPTLHSYK